MDQDPTTPEPMLDEPEELAEMFTILPFWWGDPLTEPE